MTNKKVDNRADLDLPFLVMPEKGESVTFRILTAPKQYNTIGIDNEENIIGSRCEVLINDMIDSMVCVPEKLLIFNSTIYKGMLIELEKHNIVVDKHLECLVGRVWTIRGIQWLQGPKELWTIDAVTKLPVCPTTYSIALRKELELGER